MARRKNRKWITKDANARIRGRRWGGVSKGVGGPAIIALNVLEAWYDASDLSTLFQDAGRTIPVTAAGQPVGAWVDKSGNGIHLTQDNDDWRPIYQVEGDSHFLVADDVDDGISASTRMGLTANPLLSVLMAVRPLSSTLNWHGLWGIGQNLGSIRGAFGTEGWGWRHHNGAVIFAPTVDGQDSVATWQRQSGDNYGNQTMRLNGVGSVLTASANTGNSPSSTDDYFTLFDAGLRESNARIYGVKIYSELDDTQRALDEVYLEGLLPSTQYVADGYVTSGYSQG